MLRQTEGRKKMGKKYRKTNKDELKEKKKEMEKVQEGE